MTRLVAFLIALAGRLAAVLVPTVALPAVRCVPVPVAIPAAPAVAWSAPDRADRMRTGPPRLARESLWGPGRRT
jgi:hypothetical protein